jgi:hypothetical protein
MRQCAATDAAGRCARPADPEAPLDLCTHHLLAAHDWITRDVGVTDLLPSPCLACGARLGVHYPSGWICAVCEWRVGDLPDGGASAVRVDVVYYLRYRDRIKIGTSANPRQRFSGLLYDEVLAFEPGDRLLEQRRHAQFAAFRIPRTEWFEWNEPLAEHLALLARGVDDPWAVYARWVSESRALRG